MDEKDNVTPIVKNTLTPAELAASRTMGEKVGDHLDDHKFKYLAGLGVSLLIALLQAWPTICPLLPGKLNCVADAPIAQLGVSKLQELQDAGL